MLFLGVLSVFQLILVPGLLLIRRFPGKRSFIQNLAAVFMLGLLANYAAVVLLVAVGLYTRAVVLSLFILEVAALLWLYRPLLFQKVGGLGGKLQKSLTRVLADLRDWVAKDPLSASLYVVFVIAAGLGVVWILSLWVKNFNTVYQTWDAWASWDRWAVKWALNRFPGDTWEYPQLIPVAYSIAYKFIGTTAVKFFGKSIMPLFTLMIGLMLIDLGKQFRSYGYLLSAGFAFWTINWFIGEYIPEGYVDIPVACFSLMAIYTLLKARALKDKGDVQTALLLGSLATAAAGVAKQTGLYVTAFYPILAYFWVLQGRPEFNRREALALLGRHLLQVAAIVAPWYIFIEYRIQSGQASSNIQFVINDIYAGQTLPQRFMAAMASLGSYAYLYLFLLLSLPVLNKPLRYIILLLILPFSILWALFLSYETRNLAIAFPLIALCSGGAVEAWIGRLRAAWPKARRLEFSAATLVLAGLIVLGAATIRVNGAQLVERQLSEQKQIFEAGLNDKLYRYFSRTGGPEPVISSYPIDWLPGLEGTWRLERFRDYDEYEASLQRYADVELLLFRSDADERILAEIQQNIDDGVYTPIFQEGAYRLVRIPPRE